MGFRTNWCWVQNKPWNIEQFTYFYIFDAGTDWKERYALLGYILHEEFKLGTYDTEEGASNELDRIMGHLD